VPAAHAARRTRASQPSALADPGRARGRREPQVGPPPPPAPRRLLSLKAALSCAVAAPAQLRRVGCPEA